jgi:hypothetical protein
MSQPEPDSGTVCTACEGRCWKFVTPRRGLVAVGLGEVVQVRAVREECSRCAGTGVELAVA